MAYVKGDDLKELIAKAIFQAGAIPTTFYVGLGTGSLPTADADLSDLTEVTGVSYGRKPLVAGATDFPTFSISAGSARITATAVTFTAGGLWANADYAFLTDAASGTSGHFYGAQTLDPPFRLSISGDEGDVTYEYQDS